MVFGFPIAPKNAAFPFFAAHLRPCLSHGGDPSDLFFPSPPSLALSQQRAHNRLALAPILCQIDGSSEENMDKYLAIYLLVIALLNGGLVLPASRAQDKIISVRPSPAVDITDAIAIAMQYVTDKNLDISRHFLQSVVYHDSGPWTKSQMGNGPYWQIIYEMGQYVDGGQILILVYMDKSVSHTYGK